MIDVNRLNPATYCALVLWLQGSFPTKMIADALRLTPAMVRATCRERSKGGFLPKPRKFMTRGERQVLLTHLKHYRMDEGLLSRIRNLRMEKGAIGDLFLASPIVDEPDEPVELPDTSTKTGKKKLRAEAQQLKSVEQREKVESEDGYADRGVSADPLNWLDRERLLRDPEDVANKSPLRFSVEMRRHECGLRFRQIMENAQLSGFKELSLEKAGQGGGQGVSIPEKFLLAISSAESLRLMMGDTTFRLAVAVVHEDRFIWDDVPSKRARDFIFEDIRRALDVVALFIGMMSEKEFADRWGSVPQVLKARSRDEVRQTVRTAREVIRQGSRQS